MTGKYEAELMKRRAVKLGVPRSACSSRRAALTTRENATGCAAHHARARDRAGAGGDAGVTIGARAVAAFRRAGVGRPRRSTFAERRSRWKRALRERVARAVYRAARLELM